MTAKKLVWLEVMSRGPGGQQLGRKLPQVYIGDIIRGREFRWREVRIMQWSVLVRGLFRALIYNVARICKTDRLRNSCPQGRTSNA